MAFIPIDESRWPFVVVRMPSEVSDAEWTDYLERARALTDRGEPYGVMTVGATRLKLSSAQRRQATDAMTANKELLRRIFVAHGVVVRSVLEKGVLTALDWVTGGPVFPQKAFDTEADAETWIRERLRGARAGAKDR